MAAPKNHEPVASRAAAAGLLVNVIFTGSGSTVQCLRRAASLAEGLNARIRLVVPRLVPYALPLDKPMVPVEHERRRFRLLAGVAGIDMDVDIVYGRELARIFDHALGPHSMVLIGARSLWWPAPARRFRKHLERAGHDVIFVRTGGNHG
jgi:hypothetical protein